MSTNSDTLRRQIWPNKNVLASNFISDQLHVKPFGRNIADYFVRLLPLAVVSDFSPEYGSFYLLARGIFAFLLLLTFVLPVRQSLMLLLALGIVSGDGGAVVDSTQGIVTTASIWLLYFGPLNPSWIIFTCILFQFLRLRSYQIPIIVRMAGVFFLTVPIIAALAYGSVQDVGAKTEMIIDLKFPMMLIGSLVMFLSLFKKQPGALGSIVSVFVGSLLARHFIDLCYVALNLGPEIAQGISRGSVDSAKGGAIFLVFFGASLGVVHRRWFIGSAIASLSLGLLAAYGTRMLWVTFAAGTIVLFALFSMRRRVFFSWVAAFLILLGGWFITLVNPESAEIAYLRYLTITQGREVEKFSVDVESNFISRIDPIRYGEILNIFHANSERYSHLWGSGYGGFYEDRKVYFPSTLGSSFPDYSFETGKFYRAHSYTMHIFFKYGLVGLILVSALWIIPGYASFKLLRRLPVERNNLLYTTMRCVVPFLITSMFQFYWSGKGLFMSGVLIAACITFVLIHVGRVPGLRYGRELSFLN